MSSRARLLQKESNSTYSDLDTRTTNNGLSSLYIRVRVCICVSVIINMFK